MKKERERKNKRKKKTADEPNFLNHYLCIWTCCSFSHHLECAHTLLTRLAVRASYYFECAHKIPYQIVVIACHDGVASAAGERDAVHKSLAIDKSHRFKKTPPWFSRRRRSHAFSEGKPNKLQLRLVQLAMGNATYQGPRGL